MFLSMDLSECQDHLETSEDMLFSKLTESFACDAHK